VLPSSTVAEPVSGCRARVLTIDIALLTVNRSLARRVSRPHQRRRRLIAIQGLCP
jgi:hypothetical protein